MLRKKRLLNLSGFSHLECRLNGAKNLWLTVSLQICKPPWKSAIARWRIMKDNCFPGGLLKQLENWREMRVHVLAFVFCVFYFGGGSKKVKVERKSLNSFVWPLKSFIDTRFCKCKFHEYVAPRSTQTAWLTFIPIVTVFIQTRLPN